VEARNPLDYIHSLSQNTLAEIREQLRRLHPKELDEGGIAGALGQYCKVLVDRYSINIEFTAETELALSRSKQAELYYIAREALWNVVKHARANSITVTSGMARGIDTIAHKGALSKNGRTVAILGSGLDVIYPDENKPLFEMICENGAVISEYPLGTKPDAQNFPKRNRIISGLSIGTVIIESRLTGGAIQTAALALEQNREVFAVPGNLGVVQSEGTNSLIQKGEAKLITNAEDIFVELNLKIQPEIGKNIPKPKIELNFFEQNLLELLNDQPKHIDKISIEAKMSAADCLVHLLSLEFRDLVRQLPGKNFVKY